MIRTNISYGALQIVRQTGAAGLIDPVSAYGLSLPGIVIRPIDVTVPFYWGVLTAAKRPLRPVARALMDAVEGVAERSIAGFNKLDPALAGQLSHGTAVEAEQGRSRWSPPSSTPSSTRRPLAVKEAKNAPETPPAGQLA